MRNNPSRRVTMAPRNFELNLRPIINSQRASVDENSLENGSIMSKYMRTYSKEEQLIIPKPKNTSSFVKPLMFVKKEKKKWGNRKINMNSPMSNYGPYCN